MGNNSKILHTFVLGILVFATLNNFYDLLTYNFPPKMNDFKPLYVATRVFLQGGNPYEDQLIKKEWQSIKEKENLVDDIEPGLPNFPFIHPPGTLIVLSPLGQLKWQTAKYSYFFFNVVITLCSLVLIGKIGNLLDSGKELWLLVLSFFSFKSSILGLLFGQFFYFSFFFSMMALYCEKNQKNFLSGLFMALGLLKPTIGFPFLIYLLVKKKYDVFIYSTLIFIVLNLVVAIILPSSIFGSYLDMTNQSLAAGGRNDYSFQNERFFDLTSIQTVLFFVTNSRAAVLISSIVFGLFLLSLIIVKRDIYLKNSAYVLIILICSSLLLIYHRTYDCLMLSTIFLWLKPSDLIDKIKWNILFVLPLFLPFTGIALSLKPYIPETVYHIALLNIPISIAALLIIVMRIPYQKRYY